jgi:hypothetical protein
MPGHFLRRPSLALSAAEEEAKWPHLQAAIRISAMEEEAQRAVEEAARWQDTSRRAEDFSLPPIVFGPTPITLYRARSVDIYYCSSQVGYTRT